ncbi:MAG: type II toxin-antitoxin system VapC family toxin [Lachnospiraceae bacterium]|nr:type II toxin-antitoxin system VapC family toxin [Lachnospiraceae bacterium]
MTILLDTHVAIWCLNDDKNLSEDVRRMILNPDNIIYYSAASVWEIMLKHARRPKDIPFDEVDFSQACENAGFIPLNITGRHVMAVGTLRKREHSREHHDPFDRLLLAQAKIECMTLFTHDELIMEYDEKCIIPV